MERQVTRDPRRRFSAFSSVVSIARVTSALAAGLLIGGGDASAAEVHLRLEPAGALPLSAPQTDHFGAGGGVAFRPSLSVLPFLDVQAHVEDYAFAGKEFSCVGPGGVPAAGCPGSGKRDGGTVTIFTAGAGPRIQLPRADRSFSPWVDANVSWVQTGSEARMGMGFGGGAQFALGGGYWLGPFVRYLQVLQPGDNAPQAGSALETNKGDARIAMLGLAIEMVLGEPKVVKDGDGDGIPDGDDACPTEAGPAVNKGCPDKDTDNDGIVDREDKCPKEPGLPVNGGCPVKDADGDGVVDAEDACPKTPGPATAKGCPDSDGDTVADDQDACPAVPGDVNNRGCPRYKQVVVKFDQKLELSQKVFFAHNGTTILPKSFDILTEVAQALKDSPKIKVRIEGHTDSTGDDAPGGVKRNIELSEARALSVRDFLIDQGVEPKRLDARGYGSQQPLDTNATVEGREVNRRVEFVILKPKATQGEGQ